MIKLQLSPRSKPRFQRLISSGDHYGYPPGEPVHSSHLYWESLTNHHRLILVPRKGRGYVNFSGYQQILKNFLANTNNCSFEKNYWRSKMPKLQKRNNWIRIGYSFLFQMMQIWWNDQTYLCAVNGREKNNSRARSKYDRNISDIVACRGNLHQQVIVRKGTGRTWCCYCDGKSKYIVVKHMISWSTCKQQLFRTLLASPVIQAAAMRTPIKKSRLLKSTCKGTQIHWCTIAAPYQVGVYIDLWPKV